MGVEGFQRRTLFGTPKCTELDGLTYDLSVQVIIGLDIIWKIDFKKRRRILLNDENEILKRITHVSGTIIPAPHSLRNLPSWYELLSADMPMDTKVY